MVDVLDFGADPTGAADSLQAFRDAIESFSEPDAQGNVLKTWPSAFGEVNHGGVVQVPRGMYRLSAPLVLDRSVRLVGEGGGPLPASTLVADHDTGPGVVIKTTNGNVNARGGVGCRLEGLGIWGVGCSHDGVYMELAAQLDRVRVHGFGGHGVQIDGSKPVDGNDVVRNCNNWRLRDCLLTNNDKNGLYVHGGDGNAGRADGVVTSGNGLHGFLDSAFLGGTVYSACYSEADNGRLWDEQAMGPFSHFHHEGNANRTVYEGCYVEGLKTSATLGPLGIWISGVNGGGVEGGFAIEAFNKLSGIQMQNGSGSHHIRSAFGLGPNMALRMQSDDESHEWSIKRNDGYWWLAWANSTAHAPLRFRRDYDNGVSEVQFPKGLEVRVGGKYVSFDELVARIEALEVAG